MKGHYVLSKLKKAVSFVLIFSMLFCLLPYYGFGTDSSYDYPWLWPVPGSYKINSLDYYSDGGIHNQGQAMDIDSNGHSGGSRLDVVSATSGNVLYIVNKYDEAENKGSGWGNYVIVRSGNVNIVYAHLQTVLCQYGSIKAGDVIGKMGETGNAEGVHLHVQAYYYGSASSSDEIVAFDMFRLNPLYAPKLQFRNGLSENSVRYGEWIKTYYTGSSGGYNTYSGGLETDYGIKYVDASVTVVSPSGADVFSSPVPDNGLITATVSFGKNVRVLGYMYDAYGNIWLKRADGGWIRESDVGFYDYNMSVTGSAIGLPGSTIGNIEEAALHGTVTSGNPITALKAELFKGDVKVGEVREEIGGSLSAQLDVLTDKLSRLNIGEGSYRIAVYAEIGAQYPGQDSCKEEKLVAESTFGVDSAVTDPVPPFIEGLDVLSFDGKTVTVGVRATDDKYLFGTELKAGNENYGYIVYSYEKAEGDLFIFKVDLDDFEGVSGSIKLIATATDAHNNKTVKERLFYIPEAAAGETWSAGSGINLRSAPSTTASKVKTVKSGTKVVLVEVVEDGIYVWAKTSDGYYTVLKQKSDSSLWYKYVSGNMFSVVFDYNNGNGSCTVPKRFGEAVDLSGIVPERNGYTFCGWAYSSDAKSPDYLPGGKYTADKNAVLFAVWKDEIKPTFGRVEIENTKWTNKGVNVTVVATDNSGTVFYSFDGGKNWSYNDTYFVRSNTVFGADDIAIKDEDGNIVYYGETVTVKNIDKNAPSVERFSGEAKVSGSEVTFIFEGATDAESGIGGFEITYSTKSDYADSTTVPAVSGIKEKLTDGVYYWKVRAYDEAGNYAEAECGRFRIGEAKKLGTPYSLIAAAGASYCDLSWEEVENADGYSVEVSLSSSFDDSVIVSAPSSFATVKQLVSGRKYYVRITALSEDGNFLDSDYAETTFETQSDDSTIYSFKYLADATVNEALHTCDYIAEYGTSSLDLSVETAGNADVKYYSDNTLTNEIKNYADYSLTGSSATVFILVSAENGSSSVYTLRIARADEKAETPKITVVSDTLADSAYVYDKLGSVSITAAVLDGSVVTVEWFCSDGKNTVSLGSSFPTDYSVSKEGTYVFYAVATATNSKTKVKTATAETEKYTVKVVKHTSEIFVEVTDVDYSGKAVDFKITGYTGDGEAKVRYYSDSGCKNEIPAPKDVGTYYAVAEAPETAYYYAAKTEAKKFTVNKAVNPSKPEYKVTGPSLRDVHTYVEITGDNVEYSINEGAWTKYVSKLTLSACDAVEFRFAETDNIRAGEIVKIVAEEYSGATSILPSGENGVTREGDYLVIYEDGEIDVAYILDGLKKTDNVSVITSDGVEITSGSVATGYTVTLGDEQGEVDSVRIVICGDVDCDGRVTADDAYLVMKLSNGMISVTDEILIAAGDIDGNGKLTSADALLIRLRV